MTEVQIGKCEVISSEACTSRPRFGRASRGGATNFALSLGTEAIQLRNQWGRVRFIRTNLNGGRPRNARKAVWRGAAETSSGSLGKRRRSLKFYEQAEGAREERGKCRGRASSPAMCIGRKGCRSLSRGAPVADRLIGACRQGWPHLVLRDALAHVDFDGSPPESACRRCRAGGPSRRKCRRPPAPIVAARRARSAPRPSQ